MVDLPSYYLALHELGHIVGRGRSKPLLEREANAWVYAIETAKWPLTDDVRATISSVLQSHGPAEYGGGGFRITKSGRYVPDRRREVPAGHPYSLAAGTGDLASEATQPRELGDPMTCQPSLGARLVAKLHAERPGSRRWPPVRLRHLPVRFTPHMATPGGNRALQSLNALGRANGRWPKRNAKVGYRQPGLLASRDRHIAEQT